MFCNDILPERQDHLNRMQVILPVVNHCISLFIR